MTDTARTLAAIKTLLADNTSGDISPQDMRDVVESIVAPVTDGGFDATYANVQDYVGNTVISTPDAYTPLDLFAATQDAPTDPQGWLQTSTFESVDWYGETWPSKSWFLLPPGLYAVVAFFNADVEMTSGGGTSLYPDLLLPPEVLSDSLAPYAGWTVYSAASPGSTIFGHGHILARHAAGTPVGAVITADTDDVTLTTTAQGINIVRLK